ncbi:hypothetical protein SIL82_20350 [Sphingomonas echinoides]|uniref:Oligosaccharide repeat unit polymerase n=1 Tax=Sphingomonas echinoides TaxID=59803 RepID=A0ABU4PS05_9SPHN|nr:hypothetical protein [Sphingomonas echinoides]MDX5986612.1 hypothetical protein [Sphingomonas echinoides]
MLLTSYAMFFLATMPFLFARDRLIGIVYALLFIYSFFSFLGYIYMPGYSETLHAYFGDRVGELGIYFVFASMALLFVINMALYKGAVVNGNQITKGVGVVVAGNQNGPTILWLILILFTVLTAVNYENLSWYIAELDEVPIQISFYILLFKMSSGLIVFCYVVFRMKIGDRYRKFVAPTIIYTFVFIAAAVKLGNRTDLAALIIGIAYFECAIRKIRPRVVVISAVIVIIVMTLLTLLEMNRYADSVSQTTLSERIIKNDYFAPAHVMLGAIAFNFIDPGEVIRSNFANALVRMDYPFLQKPVMDLFAPGVASRTASYAFYVFTEGFIFMGFWGFIYNAIVITGFVKLWNLLGCTSDPLVNLLIRSVIATMAINVVRGQTCYFIKYLYMFTLPVLVVGVILIGVRLVPRQKVVTK